MEKKIEKQVEESHEQQSLEWDKDVEKIGPKHDFGDDNPEISQHTSCEDKITSTGSDPRRKLKTNVNLWVCPTFFV